MWVPWIMTGFSSLKMLIIIAKGGRRVYLDCQVSLVHETSIFSGKFLLNTYYAIVCSCHEGKNCYSLTKITPVILCHMGEEKGVKSMQTADVQGTIILSSQSIHIGMLRGNPYSLNRRWFQKWSSIRKPLQRSLHTPKRTASISSDLHCRNTSDFWGCMPSFVSWVSDSHSEFI